MSKGSPSLVALLGLLAVAGFKNRDRLGSLLQGRDGDDRSVDDRTRRSSGQSDGRGMLDQLGNAADGASSGGLLAGLTELIGRFSNPQQSAKAQSWVDTGPNGALEAADLEEVLDEETLAELMQKTGLDRRELLDRLSAVLPDAVDQMTPQGRMPSAGDIRGVADQTTRGSY